MASNIFVALDQLFRGETPEQYPSPWILQRFLASDEDFAQAASEIQNHIKGPELTFEVWRSLVRPAGLSRSPKLSYVGPKREAAAEGVTHALMVRMNMRRGVAEQVTDILTVAGKLSEAARELGVDTKE